MPCHVKWTHREVYIFNGSKRVIYVNVGDGTPTYALDSGATGIISITHNKRGVARMKNTQITLGYYTKKKHDLVTIFLLHDSGTWCEQFNRTIPKHSILNTRFSFFVQCDLAII
jgi:hypothetical protein